MVVIEVTEVMVVEVEKTVVRVDVKVVSDVFVVIEVNVEVKVVSVVTVVIDVRDV